MAHLERVRTAERRRAGQIGEVKVAARLGGTGLTPD